MYFNQLRPALQNVYTPRPGTGVIPAEKDKAQNGKKQSTQNSAKTTTHKFLGTGAMGATSQKINSTVLNIEKVSRLSQGDVNAINVKAAVDIGEKLTRGKVHQVLGVVATPLAAVVSVDLMSTRINQTIEDPNADNFKLLFKTGKGATTSFTKLSKFILSHSDDLARFASKSSKPFGRFISQGVTLKTAGVVKTSLSTSQRVMGHMGSALNIGVAGLDLYIAGQDIHNFWKDPSTRNLAKMGLGIVAATGSVLGASKIPGVSGKGALAATLADAAKYGMDVNWGDVYESGKDKLTSFGTETVNNYEQHLILSRIPESYLQPNTNTTSPGSGFVGKTLTEQVASYTVGNRISQAR